MNKGLHIGVDASWVGFQACLLKICPHLQSLLIAISFTGMESLLHKYKASTAAGFESSTEPWTRHLAATAVCVSTAGCSCVAIVVVMLKPFFADAGLCCQLLSNSCVVACALRHCSEGMHVCVEACREVVTVTSCTSL